MAKYRLRRGEWFILIALALLQAAWISDPSPDTAYAQTVPTVSAGLFTTTVSAQNDAKVNTSPTIVRSRIVDVNFDVLGKASNGADLQSATARSVTLNLFPDVTLTAQRDYVEQTNSPTDFVWTGHVQGADHSQVTLVSYGGVLVGNIRIGLDQHYQVRYAGKGHHVIYQINQTLFPDEAAPQVPHTRDLSQQLSHDAMTDDGSMIDVMVVYTAAARAEAGSQTAMNNLITLAITETNQAYQNSGIIQRIRLVHSEQVTYTESGDMSKDLDRLTNKTDGSMDNVHSLRNTYGADLVVLLTPGGDYCGMAWGMETVSPSFESHGFSVVALSCATGYYSFAHELAHNMAARHDRYIDQTDNKPYTYNHGYYSSNNAWRTIMAYGDGCGGCPRIQYFSNPGLNYGGLPMGRAEGLTNAADNHKALNNTARTIANFRQTIVGGGAGNGARKADLAGLNGGVIWYTVDLVHWTRVPGFLHSLVVGDFNGDGKADLAGLNDGAIWVTVDLVRWTRVPGFLHSLVVGDFNGDGKADLAGLNGGVIWVTVDLVRWTQVPGFLHSLVVGDFGP